MIEDVTFDLMNQCGECGHTQASPLARLPIACTRCGDTINAPRIPYEGKWGGPIPQGEYNEQLCGWCFAEELLELTDSYFGHSNTSWGSGCSECGADVAKLRLGTSREPVGDMQEAEWDATLSLVQQQRGIPGDGRPDVQLHPVVVDEASRRALCWPPLPLAFYREHFNP